MVPGRLPCIVAVKMVPYLVSTMVIERRNGPAQTTLQNVKFGSYADRFEAFHGWGQVNVRHNVGEEVV